MMAEHTPTLMLLATFGLALLCWRYPSLRRGPRLLVGATFWLLSLGWTIFWKAVILFLVVLNVTLLGIGRVTRW